jgi:hypothetical protein
LNTLSLPNTPEGEQAFGTVVESVSGFFRGAENFNEQVKTTDLVDRGHMIVSEITLFESDLRTFRSNLDAATSAAWIMRQLLGKSRLSALLWQQLRLRLAVEGFATNSSKGLANEAEANALIEQGLELASQEDSIPQFWRDRMEKAIEDASLAEPESAHLGNDSSDIQNKTDVELPTLVSSINDWLERVATRVNRIYGSSEVPATESDYALTVSNGIVSYRIIRNSGFVPYVFKHTEAVITPTVGVEVARGAFAVSDNRAAASKRTVWQILRLSP